MITPYENNACKYTIDQLDKVIYLLTKNSIGKIDIDNGAAYVTSAASYMCLETVTVSLEENETIDERYEFNHTLNFTVNGKMDREDIDNGKYIVCKGKDGTYWLLNPMLPCKVSYTYTLDAVGSRTAFAFSIKSNFPLLKVDNFTPTEKPIKDCKYDLCGIDFLEINETPYSKLETYSGGTKVSYTNDGFKYVDFQKDSAKFEESFDGNNVSHALTFRISFDAYKSSWHYNLLEFVNNKYAVVIRTKCGTNLASGFGYGLRPSYTVSANDNQVNYIEITLSDLHDEGNLVQLPSDVPYSHKSGTTWAFVTNVYECVDDEYAKYLLMREYDAYGNPLDNYMCLEGYESMFEDLNIVDTFDDVIEFECDECRGSGCKMTTSIPDSITFNTASMKTFTLTTEGDFSFTTSNANIAVTPSSGSGGTYNITVINQQTPTSTASAYTITLSYCGNLTKEFDVTVVSESSTDCLPQGYYYTASTYGQYFNIPFNCCVSAVNISSSSTWISNAQVQDGAVRVYLTSNDGENDRTGHLDIIRCDGTVYDITITQEAYFRRWVKEGTVCDGALLCDVERMYSGTTSGNVNSWTVITRKTNCQISTQCQQSNTRWIESTYTTCSDGKLYMVEFMQVYSNGQWINTAQNRLGREIEDVSGECFTNVEHWEPVSGEYLCNSTTKYQKERLYYQTAEDQPQSAWTATDVYRRGAVLQNYSYDCGATGWSYQYLENRLDGTMCNGADKYLRYQLYGSNDGTNWVALGVYEQGTMVEQHSSDCGWTDISWEYQWDLSEEVSCEGYNLYYLYVKQRRRSGSQDEWKNVIPSQYSIDADGTESPVIVETESEKCGYVPPIEPQYRWVELNPRSYYYCRGTAKYAQEQRQVSMDSGNTWSYISPAEYRVGRKLEDSSVDCGGGYIPQYRTLTSATTCVGYDKYELDEYQVSYDNGRTWSTTASSATTLIEAQSEDCGYSPIEPQYRDVSGTPYCTGYDKYVDVDHQVSYDSGSTWETTATTSTLVEKNSEDCGYVPPTPIYEWRNITPTSDPNTYICNDCGDVPPTPPTPSGDSRQYLTFRPNGDTEFWFSYEDSENYNMISYSLNSGSSWTVVDHNQHTVTVHSGETIMWRGYAMNPSNGIGQFNSSGDTWEVEGNIMSLLYFDNFSGQTSLSSYGINVFRRLFGNCWGLISAENLILPATTLVQGCYWSMFLNCSSLTTAPQLPATTLTSCCYQEMFHDCTSLTTAPTLSATTLQYQSYLDMFQGCSSLNSITCLATDVSADFCTYNWLDAVAASGTFTTPSSTNWTSGKDGIPNGWTRINA